MVLSIFREFRNRLLGRRQRDNAAPSTGFAATEFSREREPVLGDTGPVPAAKAEDPNQRRPPLAAEGHRIGRYQIKGRLGSGGQGEVYDAWDPVLSREVALKVLPLSSAGGPRESQEAAILNEARAAAGLNHPSIVTVFDAGRYDQGIYIAMQRLHGRDLRDALAGGWRPTVLESAQLVLQVAEGLAYAHTQGVVHCDIKPANIFLGQDQQPKVLDFGIARRQRDQQLARQGRPPLGSPHYLAPEQLSHGQADARTDVRALGVVLYELLTRRKAYDGDSLDQVMHAVTHGQPPAAHEVRSGVPRALSAIAARAMALQPERRQASVEQLVRELRAWLDERAELAQAPVSSLLPHDSSRPPAWTGHSTGLAFDRHGDRLADWTSAKNLDRSPERAAQGRSGGWKGVLAGLLGLSLCAAAVAWLLWLPTAEEARTPTGPAAGRAAPGSGGDKASPRNTAKPSGSQGASGGRAN